MEILDEIPQESGLAFLERLSPRPSLSCLEKHFPGLKPGDVVAISGEPEDVSLSLAEVMVASVRHRSEVLFLNIEHEIDCEVLGAMMTKAAAKEEEQDEALSRLQVLEICDEQEWREAMACLDGLVARMRGVSLVVVDAVDSFEPEPRRLKRELGSLVNRMKELKVVLVFGVRQQLDLSGLKEITQFVRIEEGKSLRN